ncbi:15529_t:CDS:2 [Racocetra persica]|uniref:15529_t:CDS:1 n=1 Tax=Racocetra persica TaxID=160502 RepID=A0ACA9QQ39_9GLOM|nr:15529_t:CDS:2 [Racocetra persica]
MPKGKVNLQAPNDCQKKQTLSIIQRSLPPEVPWVSTTNFHSLPTPAPSPQLFPPVSAEGYPPPPPDEEFCRTVRMGFQNMDNLQRQKLLAELLNSCNTEQLVFVSNFISPRLKRDFLKDLPIELSLHILSFINDPKTLSRASSVSKFWRSLLNDEFTWKNLCVRHHFRRRSSITPVLPPSPTFESPTSRCSKFSYKDHFRRRYIVESNWKYGGRTLVTHISPDSGVVTSLQMCQNYIVVGMDNKKIHIFDVSDGNYIKTLTGHEGGVWALQYIDEVLVSGGCDREVRVWDIITAECKHVLHGHTSTVRSLKMKDKTIAVSGSRDATLRVWNIEEGRLLHLLAGHQASVRCMEICGDIVVSGSYDCTARVWNIVTGECLHILQGHYSQIYSIAFDGDKIVTGSLDSTARVWSRQTGFCLGVLQGHTSLVGQLQLHESILVTGGSDGAIRIWDLDTNRCVQNIAAHDNSVTCLQFDEKRIVSGGNDGHIKLWDIETGEFIREMTTSGNAVWRLAFQETKAVVLLQREGKTVMEVLDFDALETQN